MKVLNSSQAMIAQSMNRAWLSIDESGRLSGFPIAWEL